MIRPLLLAAIALGGAGCSDDEEPLVESCRAEAGACDITLCDASPPAQGEHVEVCSVIDWPFNPPSSGPHYPIWAAFQRYDEAVPRGFWLHSVEHSGVVLAYNCALFDGDCAELRSSLDDFAAARGADPLCEAPVVNRVIVTPDPHLDVAFAAIAWGHSLEASCFDDAAVTRFTDAHYGKNYENFCSGGVDPTLPDSGFPPSCGE